MVCNWSNDPDHLKEVVYSMTCQVKQRNNIIYCILCLKLFYIFFLVAISIQVYFMQNDTYLPETIT